MPAAATPTRLEIARRATQHRDGMTTREQLHRLAWAAHESGGHPTPRELSGKLSVHVATVHRHARILRKAGRWPWPTRGSDEGSDAGSREARARELISDPSVPGILDGAVARASRRSPSSRSIADELEAHAWAALWEIALNYRADSPMEWPRYLRVKLRYSLVDCQRSWTHAYSDHSSRPDMKSIHAPTRSRDGEPSTISDELDSGDLPVGWEVESQDVVESIVGAIGGRPKESLRATYLMCAGDRPELAARLGMTLDGLFRSNYDGIRAIRESMGVSG